VLAVLFFVAAGREGADGIAKKNKKTFAKPLDKWIEFVYN
jgi:hypothetical protein